MPLETRCGRTHVYAPAHHHHAPMYHPRTNAPMHVRTHALPHPPTLVPHPAACCPQPAVRAWYARGWAGTRGWAGVSMDVPWPGLASMVLPVWKPICVNHCWKSSLISCSSGPNPNHGQDPRILDFRRETVVDSILGDSLLQCVFSQLKSHTPW